MKYGNHNDTELKHIRLKIFFKIINGSGPYGPGTYGPGIYGPGTYGPGTYGPRPWVEAKIFKKARKTV